MSYKSTTALTLTDWAKRLDPNGKVPTIVELLNQTNPILEDMLFKEGNLATGHRTTVRTGLPAVAWRMLNYGVQPSKSTTVPVTDTCGILEAYAEVDKELADLHGNTNEFRLSEDQAFLEAMNQEMASSIFYGDVTKDPKKFTGLSARYSDMNAANAQNIVNAGGTGTDNASIWLVVWGDNTVHGIFPKGKKAGLDHEDLGEVTLMDANNGKYQGYRSHYIWRNGLTVKDWRYAARCANIDISNLESTSPADLCRNMIKLLHRIPNLGMGRAAFYMNRTLNEYLDIQSLEKSSLGIKVKETEGEWWNAFRNIPIRQCDALLNTESAVV
ncbi:TPA: hypothetical protein R2K53_005516 [Raoultella ornithinolytica]|nr:hypothetical protein [Raoultella ornithinolytica]